MAVQIWSNLLKIYLTIIGDALCFGMLIAKNWCSIVGIRLVNVKLIEIRQLL
jgi:hypothetical protein